MSTAIRHIIQVKTGSLIQAVFLDAIWVVGLDEMQTIINAPIDMISR